MTSVPAGSFPRHPCDPREPGKALWCGDDAAQDFDYVEPRTLAEAVNALEEAAGAARIIAGGQSLLPALRSGMVVAERLVSLRQVRELKVLALRDDVLSIGAEVTFSAFLEGQWADLFPLMRQALYAVGNHTIRNRTTFGGTIAWCNPMAALLLALPMLDATVVTTHRRLRSADCIIGPLSSTFAASEIVVAVEIRVPRDSVQYRFHKTTTRRSGGLALASMAVALNTNATDRFLRLGVVGLRDRPWVSDWHRCDANQPLSEGADVLIATAPVAAPFDRLLASPSYVKASAALVCRRLVMELEHA
jgi:CO/xanthine dehydrogenase FAD-binding subunit